MVKLSSSAGLNQGHRLKKSVAEPKEDATTTKSNSRLSEDQTDHLEPNRLQRQALDEARAIRDEITTTPAWSKLNKGDRAFLTSLLQGTSNGLSSLARCVVLRLLQHPSWKGLKVKTQTEIFKLLRSDVWMPKHSREYLPIRRFVSGRKTNSSSPNRPELPTTHSMALMALPWSTGGRIIFG